MSTTTSQFVDPSMKTGDYVDGRRVTVFKDEIEHGVYEGVTQFPAWRLRPETVNRWVWRLKQLFPLTYRTTYGEGGRKHFTVWRMWFGRCFGIDDVLVAEPFETEDGVDRLKEAEDELAESGISSDQTWRDFSSLMRGDAAAIFSQHPGVGGYDGVRFYRWGAAAYALGRMDAQAPKAPEDGGRQAKDETDGAFGSMIDPPSFKLACPEDHPGECPSGAGLTGVPGPMGGAFTRLVFRFGHDLVTVGSTTARATDNVPEIDATQYVRTADLVFEALFVTALGEILRHPEFFRPVKALVRILDTEEHPEGRLTYAVGRAALVELYESGEVIGYSRCAVELDGKSLVHGVVRLGEGDLDEDLSEHDRHLLSDQGRSWDLTDDEIARRVALLPHRESVAKRDIPSGEREVDACKKGLEWAFAKVGREARGEGA